MSARDGRNEEARSNEKSTQSLGRSACHHRAVPGRAPSLERHLSSLSAADTLSDLAGRPKFDLWIHRRISRFDWLKARRVVSRAQFGLHAGRSICNPTQFSIERSRLRVSISRRTVSHELLKESSGGIRAIPAFANTDGTSGCFDSPSATSHRDGLPKDRWLSIGFRGARASRTEKSQARLFPALFS